MKTNDMMRKRITYREVFGTFAGRSVLADILVSLDFFEACPNPDRIAVAQEILANIGIYHPQNIDRVVDALIGTANDEDLRGLEDDNQGGS